MINILFSFTPSLPSSAKETRRWCPLPGSGNGFVVCPWFDFDINLLVPTHVMSLSWIVNWCYEKRGLSAGRQYFIVELCLFFNKGSWVIFVDITLLFATELRTRRQNKMEGINDSQDCQRWLGALPTLPLTVDGEWVDVFVRLNIRYEFLYSFLSLLSAPFSCLSQLRTQLHMSNACRFL